MLCGFGSSVESLLMSPVILLVCANLKLCEYFCIEAISARWFQFSRGLKVSPLDLNCCVSYLMNANCKEKNSDVVWCYTQLIFNPILSCSLDPFSNFYSLDANFCKAKI